MVQRRYLAVGGATGIGSDVCERLMSAGHTVILMDRVEPEFPVSQYIALDLTQQATVDTALLQLEGNIDGLLNIAGLPPREGLTQSVIAVNWVGLEYVTEKVIPQINDGGVIVNLASKAGQFWQQNLEQVQSLLALHHWDGIDGWCAEQGIEHVRAYNLSKEALIVWSKLLAARLIGRRIRVVSVSPAAVSTGILDDFIKAFGDKVAANLERVGRPGNIEEIASVILSVTDPASSWLNGIDIQVDGGMGAVVFAEQFGG
ncbi:MAG: SDR family oxidoreductase [Thiolinea sp.]